jgi:hypothetical protein
MVSLTLGMTPGGHRSLWDHLSVHYIQNYRPIRRCKIAACPQPAEKRYHGYSAFHHKGDLRCDMIPEAEFSYPARSNCPWRSCCVPSAVQYCSSLSKSQAQFGGSGKHRQCGLEGTDAHRTQGVRNWSQTLSGNNKESLKVRMKSPSGLPYGLTKAIK